MEDEARERRTEEFVKLSFEFFKHLTTLSTAGALVVLAVYREVSVDTWIMVLALAVFGLTILICLVSMLVTVGSFNPLISLPSERILTSLLVVASATFMMAVVGFILLPIQIPERTAVILYLVFMAVSGLVFGGSVALLVAGRSSHRRSAAQHEARGARNRKRDKDQ